MPNSRVFRALPLIAAAGIACGGSSPAAPAAAATRSYRMGFSNAPPAPDTALASRAVRLWARRADAAIMHVTVPWAALLAGGSADSLVRTDLLPLVNAYRALGFSIVVIETDVTDPIDRTREAPELTAAGRSITEPAVQQLYRHYAVAVAADAAPDYLGLASETNLIRAVGPAGVYAAIAKMAPAAAADLRAAGHTMPLYVSVQVEQAWGRFDPTPTFLGIDIDRRDFAFIDALGLSTYPYQGFTTPSQVPPDYFARLAGTPPVPVLVTEGGWNSISYGTVVSSPSDEAQWIDRAAALLDSAHAIAWFQLNFTDLNLAAFGQSPNTMVLAFADLGLVDTTLSPKPALARWDSIYARQRR